jgi:hypothetical protein
MLYYVPVAYFHVTEITLTISAMSNYVALKFKIFDVTATNRKRA